MPWVLAAPRSALEGRDLVGLDVHGRRVAVYRLGDALFATSDTCPHAGGSLSEGCVVEGYIECPVHHALFDIRTGASDGSVTPRHLATFPVKVEEGAIYVDLPPVEETTR
jgi:nitrite reductase/ring-hydroxylating ferredoxin subunit